MKHCIKKIIFLNVSFRFFGYRYGKKAIIYRDVWLPDECL